MCTLGNLDKYILQFGQMYLTIYTNIVYNLDKYSSQFKQIYFTLKTNIFVDLDKYSLHFGQTNLGFNVGDSPCKAEGASSRNNDINPHLG